MVLDATGRDLYTTDELPGFKYGIARFLRTTRPPGGENRATGVHRRGRVGAAGRRRWSSRSAAPTRTAIP